METTLGSALSCYAITVQFVFCRLDTQFSSDEDFEPTSRTQRSDERSATSTIVLSDCDDEEARVNNVNCYRDCTSYFSG